MLILAGSPVAASSRNVRRPIAPVQKSAFFYDADTGEKLGQWTLPRAQSAEENCTIHNYNVVPIRNRYILTSGNYQAGTWVTEFTNPEDPIVRGSRTHACRSSDDAGRRSVVVVLVQPRDLRVQHHRGLNIFRSLNRQIRRRSLRLDHLNPQTQEFSLD